MSNKYKGKYKKCRECKHVESVMMVLVWVKDSCLNEKAIKITSGRVVYKAACEECNHFEKG